MNTDINVMTGGDGLWSNKSKDVRITAVEWENNRDSDEEPEYMVHVYFDPESWNVKKDGLIYTDDAFKKSLREKLVSMSKNGQLPADLPWHELDYTEQGMQGADYVHMILGGW